VVAIGASRMHAFSSWDALSRSIPGEEWTNHR
jgi:hypothetical protein